MVDAAIIVAVAGLIALVIYRIKNRQSRITQPELSEEEREKLYGQMIEIVSSGGLASYFNSNILLKKGERLILEIPGIHLCEERTGGAGPRVVLVGEPNVALVDVGDFTLTNKRFTFAGAKRSVECSLSKIVSLRAMDEGIVVSRRGKTKTEYYLGTDKAQFLGYAEADPGQEQKAAKVEWKFSGEVLKRLIQKLLQED